MQKNYIKNHIQFSSGFRKIDENDFEIKEYLGTVPGAKEGDTLYVFKGESAMEPQLIEPEKFSQWKWCLFSEIPENFINKKALELIHL